MSVADLNNIKEQIQSLFIGANTTGAFTDLSKDLTSRVQAIRKVHPGRILIESTVYPFITMYIDQKNQEEDQIATSMTAMKRLSTVDVKIAGFVQNFVIDDLDEDAADNECETLMANIETILAEDETLSDAVQYQMPIDVVYQNAILDEGASIRVGILSLECLVLH